MTVDQYLWWLAERLEELQQQSAYVTDELGYLRKGALRERLAWSASGSEGSEDCTPSKPAVDQRAERADTSWVDPFAPEVEDNNYGTW